MPKRTEAVKRAQAKYEKAKAEEKAHVQINVKFKAKADLEMMDRLKERFPDKTPSGIAREALKALDAASNRRPKK